MTYVAQEGGDHYQAEYQHWDWVTDIGMGYLPGNATKYVSRWHKKNGVADLRKAMTYIDKMIAIQAVAPEYQFNNPIGNGYALQKHTERFIEVNQLGSLEQSICECLSYKCDKYMLKHAKEQLTTLLWRAGRAAGAGVAPGATTTAPLPSVASAGAAGVACGVAGGTTTQPPPSSTSTEVAEKPVSGMEHPFGYDERQEGFHSVNRTKTDDGYNG